jgi:hypothetical protein
VSERKQLRPSSARDVGDRLKLHHRVLHADGREFNVITLRPGTRARFSTNRFHETWHILSDLHGAHLLSRLLWGLSCQRRPGTIVVIDRMHLDPNPFDAEPADPIALVPADLTVLSSRAARRLRHRLMTPRASQGTVRWHTWGLDREVASARARQANGSWWRYWQPSSDSRGALVDRVGGLLTFRASPTLLREWAVDVARLGDHEYDGMSYVELHGPDGELCRSDGEMQIFRNYRQRVAAAKVSRREVLDAWPSPPASADVNPVIWHHNSAVRARRRPAANQPS